MAETSEPAGATQEAAAGAAQAADETQEASSPARTAGVTTAVVVMVLLIRIMAVSGWDWNTAAELADAFDFDDAVPMLLGTLFEMPLLTGTAAALLIPLAGYRLYLLYKRGARRGFSADWLVILILVLILYVLFHSYGIWWPMVLTVVWGALLSVFVSLVHQGRALNSLRWLARRTGTLAAICFLGLAVLVSTPWNPKEHIELADGTVLVGHVVRAEPGFLTVLNEDRHVEIVLSGDVASRKTVEIDVTETDSD